ncbi:MAG: exodeoxyribonuclease III [candidate division Zixibacteria bacterium HGW-Zixibacteria-1]|nr:MAG: exodeoxyribonuclease III [candidate division Zixibacteria bacterium HGW-Zixibacteria-1]
MKVIRLVSWNVNGIRAVQRKNGFDWFFEARPHILCLQETKATAEQFPSELTESDGYHNYSSAAEKKGYSGVAVFSQLKPRNVQHGFGIARFDTEGRILICDYGKFLLYNIYFPNGKASKERLKYKLEFYDAFLDHAETMKKAGKDIIVCGDVNTAHKEIDLAHPKENEKTSGFLPEERAWLDKLIKHRYIDTLRMFNDQPGQYTWWDVKSRARERNVGWRIDYFFVSESLKKRIKRAHIFPEIAGSDHCPTAIDLQI